MRVLGTQDGSVQACAQLWANARRDDQLVWHHPVIRGMSEFELGLVVPWSTQGDGVPLTKAGAGGIN